MFSEILTFVVNDVSLWFLRLLPPETKTCSCLILFSSLLLPEVRTNGLVSRECVSNSSRVILLFFAFSLPKAISCGFFLHVGENAFVLFSTMQYLICFLRF